ncbi:hypothetical protein [Streptomyces sp. NPDC001508]
MGPGLPGPFGSWPADDGRDEEDQEHEQFAGDANTGDALDRSTGG